MSEMRSADGGAGDVYHGKISCTYGRFGKPDPQIAAQIYRTLDDARNILIVGAGAGIYKSLDRDVKAVDPSGSMRSQRLHHLAVTIDAVAEDFPFADDSFDVSMTAVTAQRNRATLHLWAIILRVTRERLNLMARPTIKATVFNCSATFRDLFAVSKC